MNAVEIEEAVSALVIEPFDRAEFPYQFLESFDNKELTLKRLRKGTSNRTDIDGAVLQRSNIHILTCEEGGVEAALKALRASPKTEQQKAKYILATDGIEIQAEHLAGGEVIACDYADLPSHFGFLLPLAGITTVAEIKNNAIDIKATGRLDKLYVALLEANPDWAKAENREDFNHFMAQLIFCFFAEDTGIFRGDDFFTTTIAQMSDSDGSNTREIITNIFAAMNLDPRKGDRKNVRPYADGFPYVNGDLFTSKDDTPPKVPVFTKMARTYLLRAGELDWTAINPDIFGSMIQAVADEDERSELGMHYTSVPNILKVLNPLFLDSLKEEFAKAGKDKKKLKKLKHRLAHIRVFDPACGSGNFLVIAYKKMREIEHQANLTGGWTSGAGSDKSIIPLTNFRGIELKSFAAEIARLALIIAEFQCDEIYLGQREALALFLPLDQKNWITCGNALRLDWLSVCPPTGSSTVKLHGDDLFNAPLDQAEIDFDNEGGETYICGNPPFKGSRKQKAYEKDDLKFVFSGLTKKWKNVDYVGAWLMKAGLYNEKCDAAFAFVATNSLCQGQQVPITWSLLSKRNFQIRFAHTSFKWANLAKSKAGVTVVIVGVDSKQGGDRHIITDGRIQKVKYINPYLTHHDIAVIPSAKKPLFTSIGMEYGVYYSKSAGLLLDEQEKRELLSSGFPDNLIKSFIGSTEFINGKSRYCLWISDEELDSAKQFSVVNDRILSVRSDRLETTDKAVNKLANKSHQFRERKGDDASKLFIPIVSSENRDYFPAGLVNENVVPTNKAFFMSKGPFWALAIISSRIHLAWIETICGRLREDYSYSNTLGWNTFPVPKLTEQNKQDLSRAAENILLARESHFPATIADLYKPKSDKHPGMPENLRAAHNQNDQILEEIYIGRKFKNDTERLEKLFEMYTAMTTKVVMN